MSKSKILIIGGAGFIGGNLTLSLLKEGYKVRVFTRSGRSITNISKYIDQIELFFGDFMDDSALRKALSGVDKVIHLISTTFPSTSLDSSVYDINSNLVPTVRLLELCKEFSIQNLVYASSGGTIYGEPKYNPIDENHPLNPKSIYGHSKKVIEDYMTFYARSFNMNIQILRISNPYGPFQNLYGAQGLIAVAFGALIDKRTFNIFGNGETIRDYIYIYDVMSAFIKAIEANEASVLNISSGEGKSINDILALIEKVSGQTILKKHIENRNNDININILDNKKALEVYNWKPNKTLEQGIQDTWEWVKSKR